MRQTKGSGAEYHMVRPRGRGQVTLTTLAKRVAEQDGGARQAESGARLKDGKAAASSQSIRRKQGGEVGRRRRRGGEGGER